MMPGNEVSQEFDVKVYPTSAIVALSSAQTDTLVTYTAAVTA